MNIFYLCWWLNCKGQKISKVNHYLIRNVVRFSNPCWQAVRLAWSALLVGLNFQIPGGLNSKVVQLSEIFFVWKTWIIKSKIFRSPEFFLENYFCKYIEPSKTLYFKFHILWEGHKILWNLHLTVDYSTYSQNLGEDFAKFCGLLRIYEL